MDTVIAIGLCVGLAILVITPIVKNTIRVEKLDDSNWFYNEKEFEIYDAKINSKEKDE